ADTLVVGLPGAEVDVRGAVGHEHRGPAPEWIGRVIELENAVAVGRIIRLLDGRIEGGRVLQVAVGLEPAATSALEIEEHLVGRAAVDPEVPRAAFGAAGAVS